MSTATISRSCFRALKAHRQSCNFRKSIPLTPIARQIRPVESQCLIHIYATRAASTATTISTKPISKPEPELEPEPPTQSSIQEQYVAKNKTEILFKECAKQADYIVPQAFERDGEVPKNAAGEELGEGVGWWYETCKLEPIFMTWWQITALHLYLLIVRLRYLPHGRYQVWQQHLSNHFFYEAEHRMTLFHKITSASIRNRHLKDLYNQWRGVIAAYDEGLSKGDAVLATAIWRNVFKGDENADWQKIAQITSFVRRSLAGLDKTSEDTLLQGKVKFAGPRDEEGMTRLEARGMKSPFEKEDEVQWQEWEAKKMADSVNKR